MVLLRSLVIIDDLRVLKKVPKSVELEITTMSCGEKGVIYVGSQYYTESPLIHVVEGVDKVYFEVELVYFIQEEETDVDECCSGEPLQPDGKISAVIVEKSCFNEQLKPSILQLIYHFYLNHQGGWHI